MTWTILGASSQAVFIGLGAVLAGLGSLLSGIAALRIARRRGAEDQSKGES